MPDDELQPFVSDILYNLFSANKSLCPISSLNLLLRIIQHSKERPILRLTELPRFNAILTSLSTHWDKGSLCIAQEGDQVTVVDVLLSTGRPKETLGDSFLNSRKRKRVIDEEADSAAGDENEEEEEEAFPHESQKHLWSTLANLSKEQREVYAMVQRGTAKGRLLAEEFASETERFEPICSYITKDDCAKARAALAADSTVVPSICDRIHFRPLIRPHTDVSLGHCSYLNTCYSEPTYAQSPSVPAHHPGISGSRGASSLPSGLGAGGRGKEKQPCRYLHYEIDWDASDGNSKALTKSTGRKPAARLGFGRGPPGPSMKKLPPQWINCDLRRFDYSVLGKFHVIMADPPWDIHMSLPYGTMTDDEMRAMPIPGLQDEGFLFLWVTGRAMEVGRECLRVWGYTRVDEVVWVKTNQLQRVIRTGRTGHWLNHTKEHMLVGIKTNPQSATNEVKFPSWANRGLDTDVIVAEVRETSRKPDEVYNIIERVCPGGRKVEIFGRKHNTRPGWLTLGNQLGISDQVWEEDMAKRIKAKYPDRVVGGILQQSQQ